MLRKAKLKGLRDVRSRDLLVNKWKNLFQEKW